MKKFISIVTPCYNEEGNVHAAHDRIAAVMATLPQYEYEHIYIDNKSTDNTRALLEEIAAADPRVKLIFNLKNFGPGPSSAYGLFAGTGDAVVNLACDMQDPPEYIPDFIHKWEQGAKVVWGQKNASAEKGPMKAFRDVYYKIIGAVAEEDTYDNVTGYGLYDKEVVDRMRELDDPYPVFRYIVLDIGYRPEVVPYCQADRTAGKSSYSFISYLDLAIANVCQTSYAPIRLITLLGAILSGVSFVALLVTVICALAGIAGVHTVLLVLILLIACGVLFSVGLVGEYVCYAVKKIYSHKLIYEEKRINF